MHPKGSLGRTWWKTSPKSRRLTLCKHFLVRLPSFPACGMAETDRVGGKFSAISLPANSKPNFVEGKLKKTRITEKTVDLEGEKQDSPKT